MPTYDSAATIEFRDKEVREFLASIGKNIEKFQSGHRKIAAVITAISYQDFDDHFQQEMGPDGPWKAWSPSYAAMMRRIGRDSNKILSFTGRLRANFKPTNWRAANGGFQLYNNATTAQGFPYAFAHDNNTAPRRKLPRRSFMWLSDKALSKMSEQILEMFMRGEIR